MVGVSTLGQILTQNRLIAEQQQLFTSLSTQLTTGKKTQEFKGLGTDALTSKRARADIRSLDTYINNITNADRRIELTLTAIEEFKAQAENFVNALINFSQESDHQEGEVVYFDDPTTPDVVENIPLGRTSATPDVDFETLQDLASNILPFMIDLLNVQEGDRYLLGGTDTTTQPVSASGTLDAAVSNLLGQWKTGGITTTDLISDLEDRTALSGNPDAITDTIIGYSSALSAGNVGDVFVRISEVSEVDYTVLANDQAFRDIIVATSYFANPDLGPITDVYEPPNAPPAAPDVQGAPGATSDEMRDNFYEVFNSLTGLVNRAIDDIDQLRFKLETARARIDETKQSHIQQQSLLQSTVSGIEDADATEVALQLNTLQIQLDASFRVTARLQELSLVNFI